MVDLHAKYTEITCHFFENVPQRCANQCGKLSVITFEILHCLIIHGFRHSRVNFSVAQRSRVTEQKISSLAPVCMKSVAKQLGKVTSSRREHGQSATTFMISAQSHESASIHFLHLLQTVSFN